MTLQWIRICREPILRSTTSPFIDSSEKKRDIKTKEDYWGMPGEGDAWGGRCLDHLLLTHLFANLIQYKLPTELNALSNILEGERAVSCVIWIRWRPWRCFFFRKQKPQGIKHFPCGFSTCLLSRFISAKLLSKFWQLKISCISLASKAPIIRYGILLTSTHWFAQQKKWELNYSE